LHFQSEEEIVEVTLMVLSLMRESVSQRLDLQIKLDSDMIGLLPLIFDFKDIAQAQPMQEQEHAAPQHKYRTPLIQQRMLLLIGELFQTLFTTLGDDQQKDEMWDKIVCWLFENIQAQNKPADKSTNLVQLQVFDTIEAQLGKAQFQDIVDTNFDYLMR